MWAWDNTTSLAGEVGIYTKMAAYTGTHPFRVFLCLPAG
jgi:hypothetical protein